MPIYTPYTYRVTSKTTGQHYYGVRYARDCHPDDLWVSYFTSSVYIKRIISQYGVDDFTTEVRKIFEDANSAVKWENEVLKRLNVLHNTNWLNKNYMGVFLTNGPVSQQTRNKIRKARGGSTQSKSTKHKKSVALKGNKNNQHKSIHLMQQYVVIHPCGFIEKITGLNKFCREHNISASAMCNIANGKVKKDTIKVILVKRLMPICVLPQRVTVLVCD